MEDRETSVTESTQFPSFFFVREFFSRALLSEHLEQASELVHKSSF